MFSASKTAAPVSGSFQVSNSLRFRQSASAYLNRTPSVAGNQKTWTWSGWVKLGVLSTCNLFVAGTTSSNRSELTTYNNTLSFDTNDGSWSIDVSSTAVFRDPSAWYHFVIAVDTTQATASNRVKLYVNGVQITSFTTSTYPSQNYNTVVNSTAPHSIGRNQTTGVAYFDGYMAEINFIDGQALTPSSFGSINATTGVWQPARYTGSYGTNGFYLKFNNGNSTTTLGNDSSGNGNNWTTNNISLTAGSTYDWMLDSPTSYAGSSYGVGNYAVLNPLSNPNGPIYTVSSANLNYSCPASSGNAPKMAVTNSIGVSTGKWYCEATETSSNCAFGITSGLVSGGTANGPQYAIAYNGGTFSSTATYSGTSPTFVSGDIIGLAFDASAKTLAIYKNGTLLGSFSGLESSVTNWFFLQTVSTGAAATSSVWNFGQRPFAYTPPSGFKSLCTQNLPAPAIYNGANHMAATTYTGNGSTLTVSNANNGVSFQPDFVWIKNRSGTNSHQLADSVRGVTKYLFSDATLAEETRTNQITAFSSTGFSLDSGAAVNTSANNFVGWQWKAGGTAVSNTSGTITSSVSANPTAGFSVVTYTGTGSAATIGHGLGVAPSFIIVKWRSGGSNQGWPVYHVTQGNQAYLALNSTAAVVTSYPTMWNSTTPTSTVFSVGTGETWTNNSAWTYVAYCFAAIAGYSAFGSFSGNASTDGTFVYCGFQPKFVLVKCSSTTGNWYIFDSSRNTYNVLGEQLYPNLSNAGSTVTTLDFLSNGFKMRIATDPNASATYIYAAFASSPFQNSLAF